MLYLFVSLLFANITALQSFAFFAPYLCADKWFALKGLLMYVSGPVLARWWVGAGDEREAASTWCFLLLGNIFALAVSALIDPFAPKKRKAL